MNNRLISTILVILCIAGAVSVAVFTAVGGEQYVTTVGRTNYVFSAVMVILFLFLLALAVLLAFRVRRLLTEKETERFIDEETGMGNLRLFQHNFKYNIDDGSRRFYYFIYIILDSSYLQTYHSEQSFGDLLKYAASVLLDHTEDGEFSARIAENGFGIALQCKDDEQASRRVEALMTKLNNFENAKERKNTLIFHGAMYHLSRSDRNCEVLLFNLHNNCNRILSSNTQLVYCDVHSMNQIQEEKKLTESILNGFKRKEFKMYLQFIVDNKTKEIISAEALSRWENPEKGLMMPGCYIADMERVGLISKLDYYMFEQVCSQLETWCDTSMKDVSISCNFTRITLSEEDFIEKMQEIIRRYHFDHSKLSIEITEDVMEKKQDTASKNVAFCKEQGFGIYLDDLGSGYTALASLCDYPVDVVKIDRSILLKTNTFRGKKLFSGIVALTHSLNMKVVCEGVETEEQNSLVTSTACDYIQGWYYSKAIPLDVCESFMINYAQG